MTQTIATIPHISEAQAAAWLGMAEQKNIIAADLQTYELQAQGLLLPVQNSQLYSEIDAALAAYRKLHTDTVEHRKGFTNKIDAGIVQPLMAFEKRIDPKVNEAYVELTARSLSLRQQEAANAAAANVKNQAVANFKAHCVNEFYRVAEELRGKLRREIGHQYKLHLEQRISPTMEKIKELLKLIPIPPTAKFTGTVLSTEELGEIYKGLNKPDFADIFNDAFILLETTFANFDSDLANAAAAIAHQKEQEQLAEVQAAQTLAEEMAMNTLIATSETVVVDAPKVKKTLQITVIESELWAKTIMAAFITNMQFMTKYIKVKSWSKLSIGQMAEYLSKYSTEEGVQLKGLQYEEICK